MTDDAALVFNRSGIVTVSNAISGSGSLAQSSSGVIILTGATATAAPTTISQGTLQIGNGGTSGALGSGAVTDNGTLVFNRSDAISVSNAISGTGAVTLSAGTVTLSGATATAV